MTVICCTYISSSILVLKSLICMTTKDYSDQIEYINIEHHFDSWSPSTRNYCSAKYVQINTHKT